jgi:hypothetical protein
MVAQDGADRVGTLFGGYRDVQRAHRRGFGWWCPEEASRHARARKSGSARTLLATNRASRWFFVFGFEKNERANVTGKEVEALQQLAADLLRLSPSQLDEHVGSDALKEICHDNQSQGRKQDS